MEIGVDVVGVTVAGTLIGFGFAPEPVTDTITRYEPALVTEFQVTVPLPLATETTALVILGTSKLGVALVTVAFALYV